MNLPNILTVVRMIAAPLVALVFLLPRPMADMAALILFIGASVTDWFDGYLARKWNQTSSFGRMLDPIADKAMVMIALAVLLMLGGPDPWLFVPATAIFTREVAVSGLREHLAGRATIHVTKLAKWKTTLQMAAIAVLFFAGWAQFQWQAGPAATVWWLGVALIWGAAALTVVTGWQYFSRGMKSPAMTGEKA